MTSSQLLVVLQPSADADRALAGVDVVHRVSPTVVIVQVPPGVPSPQTDHTGVRYAGQDPPPELLTDLDEGERLFVEGWVARETRRATAFPRGAELGRRGDDSTRRPAARLSRCIGCRFASGGFDGCFRHSRDGSEFGWSRAVPLKIADPRPAA